MPRRRGCTGPRSGSIATVAAGSPSKAASKGPGAGTSSPSCNPSPATFRVLKHHLGAFWDTNLDKILRGNGVETVVVTGTATKGCVFDTALGASANDYYTVVVNDCVTQNDQEGHELGMKVLTRRYDHPNSDELVTLWSEAKEKATA